jgi:hypothetical protein
MDNFSGQRNYGLTVSTASWVFFLDADERVSSELAEDIRRVIALEPVAGKILRRNFALHRRFRFGHLAPDWVTRLFPRGRVHWVGDVHESPQTDLPVVPLAGNLEHHTYQSWGNFITKMQRYAQIWATEAAQKGQKASVPKALVKASFNFFKMLILKFGVLDGPAGVAVSAISAYYTLHKYLLLNDINKSKED